MAATLAQTYSKIDAAKMSEALTRAYSPKNLRWISENLVRNYPQENLRLVRENLLHAASQTNISHISQTISRNYSHENLARVRENLMRNYSQESLRHLTEGMQRTLSGIQLPSMPRLSEAVAGFERDMAAADAAAAPPQESRSLGAWLATRPATVQAALIFAALQVVDAFTKFLEEASGEDVPDTLQAATTVAFTVMAFLLLYINERSKPPDS